MVTVTAVILALSCPEVSQTRIPSLRPHWASFSSSLEWAQDRVLTEDGPRRGLGMWLLPPLPLPREWRGQWDRKWGTIAGGGAHPSQDRQGNRGLGGRARVPWGREPLTHCKEEGRGGERAVHTPGDGSAFHPLSQAVGVGWGPHRTAPPLSPSPLYLGFLHRG